MSVLLGDGTHSEPAGEVIEVVTRAWRSCRLVVVVVVVMMMMMMTTTTTTTTTTITMTDNTHPAIPPPHHPTQRHLFRS